MNELDPGASAPASLREAGVRGTADGTDFSAFFSACWGMPPFAWQTALAQRVLNTEPNPGGSVSEAGDVRPDLGGWPEAIALPTAAGKTACVDIAVFALAAQATRMVSAQRITAPRRIFFVVDRRIIVDEAYRRAKRLARKLAEAQHGIVRSVADNLRLLAHGFETGFEGEQPLAVYTLRGGMYRSEAWARNPLQPMVVASTVDQIGSRLLFRAYGRGPGTWPIYAGLVANDSIILLDEAHCAQPFWQTLNAVSRFRGDEWAETPLRRCFHPVVMSATPPPGIKDVFRDPSDEGRDAHHVLGRRQLAGKPAALRSVAQARGPNATAELSNALADEALGLLGAGRQAIVVFVNRVATARHAYRRLGDRPEITRFLLTGRMRPVDKERTLRRMEALRLHSIHSADRALDRPVVVVATQTLEVGADLDFDGLVTECASLDALRQRFGRLNRMGRDIAARGMILIRRDQERLSKGDDGDPVYGRALARTWQYLKARKDDDGRVDFGIASMDQLLSCEDSLTDLLAPSPDASVLLPAHIDCLAQTHPEPQPSPEVSLFLRGPRAGAPDVLVCWRADVDLANEATWGPALESLRLCPPCSSEALPVPVGVFQRWLAGVNSIDESSDVEGASVEEAPWDGSATAERRVVRWRGNRTTKGDITSDPASIRPGDVLVMPTTHPGRWSDLGDIPAEAAAASAELDVADPSHRMARAKPILRLHPDLVAAWPESVAAKRAVQDLLDGVGLQYEEDPEAVTQAVRRVLVEIVGTDADLSDRWSWLPQAACELLAEYPPARFRHACHVVSGRQIVVAGRRLLPKLAHAADSFSDEDDTLASGTSRRNGSAVLLAEHLQGVRDYARLHASASGLGDDLTEALVLAGLLHDAGKADPRFQAMLLGGSRWQSGPVLAKSAAMPQTGLARLRARTAAGYPAGRPHPLVSARLAEPVPTLGRVPPDIRDLVLHLVASHHGQCRPFAPVIDDDHPRHVVFRLNGIATRCSSATGLERADSGVADRYWRLTRRYGWWGLAWLEALLRLADWRQSEREQVTDA